MKLHQVLVKAEQGYAIRRKDWRKDLYVYMDLDGRLYWGHTELLFCETFDLLKDEWELF